MLLAKRACTYELPFCQQRARRPSEGSDAISLAARALQLRAYIINDVTHLPLPGRIAKCNYYSIDRRALHAALQSGASSETMH